MAVSICFLTVSAMAGVTLAAITTGSVISAPASRAGMSAQPLGGGKRPTCEVLIRLRLRRMFPSSLVPAFDPGHDHTTDSCNTPGENPSATTSQLRTRSLAICKPFGWPILSEMPRLQQVAQVFSEHLYRGIFRSLPEPKAQVAFDVTQNPCPPSQAHSIDQPAV